jgi:coiled-coil and C2 domain-containing protein 1
MFILLEEDHPVAKASERMQGSSLSIAESEETLPEMTQEDKSKLFDAPQSASSVLDALQQRLKKYGATAQAAKEEGSSSKARRMGRIVKQYQEAIKAYKAGQAVDYEDLPCPPGFPPIPVSRPVAKSPSMEPLPPPPPLTIPEENPTSPSQPLPTVIPPPAVSPAGNLSPQPMNNNVAKISPRGVQRQSW